MFHLEFSEADVVNSYPRRRKHYHSTLGPQDSVKDIMQTQNPRSSNHVSEASKTKKNDNDACVPHGFPPKHGDITI